MDLSVPAAARAADCSDAEWAARQQLAGCYRVFAMLGWAELIYNHISLRVPGSPDDAPQFLINPFGLHYTEVKASNLVKIGLDGRAAPDARWPVNPAGFTPHATIHAALADAHCVMHTHTTAGLAVACSRQGLSHDNFYGAQFAGRVGYHDFEGITTRADEGPRLVASIRGGSADGAPRPALILRNHGLLVWGRTLPEAFYLMWALQRACEVQLAGAALGPAIPIGAEVHARCQQAAAQHFARGGVGQVDFDAMLRLVERDDRGWRD